MPYYNFKCPNCHKQFYVDSQYQHLHGAIFKCDGCGKEFTMDFFDLCPSCKQYAGFYNNYTTKDALLDFGSNAVLGYLNPIKGATKFIGGLLNNATPNAGIGVCSMCGKKFIRCPKCGTLTSVPLHSSSDDTFLCSNCGNEMTMDTEYVDEGAPVNDYLSPNDADGQVTNDVTYNDSNLPSNNIDSDLFVEMYNDFFANLNEFTDTKENLKDKFLEMDGSAAKLKSNEKAKVMFLKAFACLCYLDNTGDASCMEEATTYLHDAYKISYSVEVLQLQNIITFCNISERTYKDEDDFIDAYLTFKSLPPEADSSLRNTLLNLDYYKEEYTFKRGLAAIGLLTISPLHTISYNKVVELVDILCNSGNDNFAIMGWGLFGGYRNSEDDEIRCFSQIIDKLKDVYPAYQENSTDPIYLCYTLALSTLGCDYLLFKEHKDVSKGLMMLRDAIEKYNCPVAQNALGKFNLEGIGQKPNYDKAFEYFSNAAQAGDSYGMYFLGVMFEKGLGTEKNIDEAIKWYQKADEIGGYLEYFYGEDLTDAKTKIRELQNSVNNLEPTNKPLSKVEQEYIEDLKDFMGDEELTDREKKMLDRMRIARGISEARAKELQLMLNTEQLSEDEQEYKDMYDEYMAKGSLTDKERHRLDRFAAALGISDERRLSIEKSSISKSVDERSNVKAEDTKKPIGLITYLNRFVYEEKEITREGLLFVLDNFFKSDCPDCKEKFETYDKLSLSPTVKKPLGFIEAVYYSLLKDEWDLNLAIGKLEYYPQQTPVTLTGKFEELSNERLFLWMLLAVRLKRDFVSERILKYLKTKRHYAFVDFGNNSLPKELLNKHLGWSYSQIVDHNMPRRAYKHFVKLYFKHFLDPEYRKGEISAI